MNAVELLSELAARGVDVRTDGGRLRVRAPEGALTEQMRRLLAEHKQELLRVLRERPEGAGAMVPDPAHAHDPFPLGDIQQAYWIGRGHGFDIPVAAHSYAEYDREGLDPARLAAAWRRLLARHPMLRAVVDEDGRQRILPEAPAWSLPVHELRALGGNEVERRLAETRTRLSHRVEPSGQWPPFKIELSLLPEGRCRTHLSGDLVAADAWSWQIIARELGTYYGDPGAPRAEPEPLRATFRDYLLAERGTRAGDGHRAALAYWRKHAATLPPPPELPLADGPGALPDPRFTRLTATLPAECWERVKDRASAESLTASAVLLSAYTLVLADWSKNRRFCLNQTLFNRLPLHPQIAGVVGDFTNFTLLDVDCTRLRPFTEHTRELRDQLFERLAHSSVSGVEILREVARQRGPQPGAPAPVVFTSILSNRGQAMDAFAWLGRQVFGVSQTPQVWLDQQVYEEAGALVITWDHVEGLFADGVPEAMFEAYTELLTALATDEERWTGAAPLVPAPARAVARAEYNATGGPRGDGDTLHGLFRVRAAATPEATAVLAEDRTLSYGELDAASDEVAAWLAARGTRRGGIVAVVMDKGWEQAVAVLGVLKSGAAYLPVDAHWPAARRAELLERAGVRCVLTQSWSDPGDGLPAGAARLAVDRAADRTDGGTEPAGAGDPAGAGGPAGAGAAEEATADDLAYVIFTSGSTGRPKGVAITHRAAVNTVLDINHRFTVTSGDRVLGVSGLTFDLSVWDIFGTFAAGGALVLPGPEARRDPVRWTELINRHGVTVWNSAPALMQLLTDSAGDRPGALTAPLRLVLLSGDWIPVTLPDRIRALRAVPQLAVDQLAASDTVHRKAERCPHTGSYSDNATTQRGAVAGVASPPGVAGQPFAPETRVVSLGGATEAAIWSVHYDIRKVDPAWRSIPYGYPLGGQHMYVLDERLEPCPDWVVGEICIGGAGVAVGYWGAPEQTEQAFVTHPRTGERLYRTGDLGRFHPAGHIEFLGREDQQVKIAGYRIELEEIESVLLSHPEVQSSAVVVRGEAGARRHLVACAVPAAGAAPDSDALLNHLAERLPGWMVPRSLRLVPELPLTANGKLDRARLARLVSRPEPAAPAAGSAAESAGGSAGGSADPVLDAVLSAAGRVLDLERLGPDVPLLVAGADSLGLVRLATELGRELGAQPPVEELFRLGTPRAIAAWCAHRGAPAAAGRAARERTAVLTDPAERERFARGRPALRPAGPAAVPLADAAVREVPSLRRRTVREFAPDPVPYEAFCALLGSLRQRAGEDGVRARYPSAGAVHAVQLYADIRPGGVAGIVPGTYYHHPEKHVLVPTGNGAGLSREAHWPVNREVFDGAAFSLALVAELAALEPLYGAHARDLALVEAGCQAQLLATVAPAHGIGLCPVGGMAGTGVREVLGLGATQQVVHSLLGGARPAGGAAAGGEK